jgi:hypothetical protein
VDASGTGSDVFAAGDKGVFWSNDGGETFRPVNRWVNSGGSNVCPPTVNCLFAFAFCSTSDGCVPPAPPSRARILAGTSNAGLWYMDATALNQFDWTSAVWHPCPSQPSASDTIRHFSREKTNPPALRACGPAGVWGSSDGLNWSDLGGGDVNDCRLGQIVVRSTSVPGPLAPSGNITWGTVNNNGVQRGTGGTLAGLGAAPEAISWETRNGSGSGSLSALGALNSAAVIQLSDSEGTVLYGTNGSSGKWIYRSPDEGLTLWEECRAGLENSTGNVTDFVESSNGDVLCSVNGTGTQGGAFLSGDAGRHWVYIAGFDTDQQDCSTIISDNGSPPTYYAGAYSNGSYATTIEALTYPAVTNVGTSSGSSSGGTSVTITGTDFQCSCPKGYGYNDDCSGQSQAVAVFGGVDATTTSCSSTSLTVTTPAHPGGTVAVSVRNPDTRAATASGTFAFSEVEGGSPAFNVTLSKGGTNVVVSWQNAPGSGASALFRSTSANFSTQLLQQGVSGTSGSWTDTSSVTTNGYLYFYKVD